MRIFTFLIFIISISFFSATQKNVDEELAYQYYLQADYERAAVLLEELLK